MKKMEIIFGDNLKIDAAFGDFVVKTDQAVRYGGDGSAPQPFDLFLASLGTCAGIYVKRFCMERKIPTDAIRIVQEVESREKGGLAVIRMTIQMPPDFHEHYKQTVINSANLCTVKRVMQDPPEFQIQVETVPE